MRRCGAACAAWLSLFSACGASPFGLSPPRDAGTLGGDGGGTSGNYHPVQFALPENHGPALKRQVEDCRMCHGNDLAGGRVNVSCDSCHARAWRTNCTYCHGGGDNDTGAPPRELQEVEVSSFPAHTAHVRDTAIHAAFDCTTCHVKPMDVLSANHVFDDTPDGRVETRFLDGIAPAAVFTDGECSNNYCHGNGRTNGTVRVRAPRMTCASCHASSPTTGRHRKHATEGVACYECHADVVDRDDTTILNLALHVNGRKDVAFTQTGFTYVNGRCSGTCHREAHNAETW